MISPDELTKLLSGRACVARRGNFFMGENSERHRVSGVYFLCTHQHVVYVGQSLCIANRVRTHAYSFMQWDKVVYLEAAPQFLLWIEGAFIRALQPHYNFSPGAFHPHCAWCARRLLSGAK